MFAQRYELSGIVGGFTPQDIVAMPKRKFEERGDLEIPESLIRQVTRFGDIVRAVLSSIHTAADRSAMRRETVLVEALPNLYIHGMKGNAELQSHIKLSVSQQRTEAGERIQCVLAIDDHAPVFADAPDPTRPENLETPKGRGILIMEHFGVSITQLPHPGGQTKTVVYSWIEDTKPLEAEEIATAASEGGGGTPEE